ncbi:enoyl-CoA hydratase/Enoyl-CoA isomerase/3-hydroxyacyl-CoA dehydrogenase [Trypanosoma theileri]|uniref:Enoyl-CoA hydratase/Enoyl-CoA isomerase/3-hydroxyacyl-CoA dehydrogenase n=1 Tax=Trypanosoma theileri TaxID=67003 RepID=A0A1X0NSP5_9TRYP|nr:enoyl-CoA hydratase/Enoyl-CoA isomerase/3-hydroxyacyl-CoA dehydrogenase [Trypanosoma theileri]ORC87209.1 enoyl-CoA hydratase/Enoyl-CoA isomerase/3-hydroxyacyl-CoA dehydrogenase [Trypanosoma theileri]
MQRVETLASHVGYRSYCHMEQSENCAIIILHQEPFNALTTSMRAAIHHYFCIAQNDPNINSIIITGDGGAFSCGVDTTDFKASALQTSYENDVIPTLAALTNMVEACSKVVVAAIHGMAFSGGLELALASHYRVATPASVFSFPEVQLGIVPCGGGTQRLPRLIGVRPALGMITTSRKVNAYEALDMGLIDHITKDVRDGKKDNNNNTFRNNKKETLTSGNHNEAVIVALSMLKKWKNPRRLSCENGKLGNTFFNRLVLAWMKREIMKKTPKGVKAPLFCLEAIQAAITAPSFADGLKEEMRLFLEAMESPEASAMQHLLRSSREALRSIPASLPGVGTPSIGCGISIRRLGVIGCGTVGMGVVLLALRTRLPVVVVELNEERCQQVLSALRAELEIDVANNLLSQEQHKLCLTMLSIIPYNGDLLSAMRGVDLLLECVSEDLELKKKIFARMSTVCSPECVMASSTSSLRVGELAKVTQRPEKVIGMHFIPPSDITPLLEIAQGECTDRYTLLQAVRLGRLFHKAIVITNDVGARLTTRLFSTCMYQSFAMLEQGAFPFEIDRALRMFGFRIGVFALEDLAGLDFSAKIRGALQKHGRSPFPAADVFTISQLLVEEGRLGQKTGRGWYSYESGSLLGAVDDLLHSARREEEEEGEDRVASWGVWRKGGAKLRRKPRPDRAVELLILDVCRRKEILRRDISAKEIVERFLFVAINEAAKLLGEGVVSSSAAVDVALTFGYGFPAWKGGLCYYADKFGLANVVCRMHIYNRALGDALFPPPCEELVAMASSQQTFRSKWP